MSNSAAVQVDETRPHKTIRARTLIEELRIRLGMMTCILLGHTVAWGPCPRCHRRAPG